MTHYLLESDDAGVQTVSYEHSLFTKKINAVLNWKRKALRKLVFFGNY